MSAFRRLRAFRQRNFFKRIGVSTPVTPVTPVAQTLATLPVTPFSRWHPAFSTVVTSNDRVVSASDMQGVAGLTEGVVGNGPQAMVDGNGRKFWRFSESEFLNVAAAMVLDNRNSSAFFVGRIHRNTSGNPIFSGGNVAQGTQLSGSGLMDVGMASVSAPFLRCVSRAGSLDATNAMWMVPGSQMQVMGAVSRTTANGGSSTFINERKASVGQNTINRPVLTGGEIGRNPTSTTQLGMFDLYELIIYNTALSDAVSASVQSALMSAHSVVPVTNQIVLEGDSITQGTGTVTTGLSSGMILSDPAAGLIPADWRVVNVGTSGNQISHLLAKRDVASGWPSMLLPSGQNVVAFEIGRNDFGSGALTATQHYANVVAYLNTPTTGLLQRGWTVRELANIASASTGQVKVEEFRAMIRSPQFLTDTQTAAGQAYAGKLSIVSTDLIKDGSDNVFLDQTDSGDVKYFAGDNTHPNVLGAVMRVTGGSTPQYGIAYRLGVASLNRNVNVLFVGDSTTAGVGADPTGATDVNGARPFSVPLKARDWLNSNGVAAIAESVAGDNNVGVSVLASYRSDVAVIATPSTSTRSPTTGGLLFRHTSAGGSGISFTTSVPVDTFKFWYPKASGFGVLQVAIDDVAYGTYSGAGTVDEHGVATITGLSLGIHKITFSNSSGTAHGPAQVQAWDSAKKTVQIINAGARNWQTSSWVIDTYPSNPLRSMVALSPDITVIDIGINDWRQSGTTIATTKANIQSMINSVTAAGSKVILVVPNGISGYSTTTDAWSQAAALLMYQQLAAENSGVVLIDAPAVYYAAGLGTANPATYASLSAAGHMYDSFHPKAAVYEAEGNAVAAAIKTICASNGWLV